MKKVLFIFGFFFISLFIFCQDDSKSSNGSAILKTDDYLIIVGLVNNHKDVMKEWDDPNPSKVPGIPAKFKFKQNDLVVPFIAFNVLNKEKINNDLLYNIYLIEPSGKISDNKMEKLIIKKGKVNLILSYRAIQLYGWGFDETDTKGNYKVVIEIYDNDNFNKKIELNFILE